MRSVLFAILMFIPLGLFADKQPLTLEAAEALERDQKYDAAMAVYEEWLKDHDTDARFAAVLRRCGDLKKNPLAAIELYKNYLPRVRDVAVQRALKREMALLYALLGDNRAALFYFEQTFADSSVLTANDPWLAVIPALYLSCGETDKAYAWVERVEPLLTDQRLRGELNYDLLEIYLVRNDTASAEKALAALENGFAKTVALPKALLRMAVYHLSRNDREKATALEERLHQQFPESLEFQAAARLLSGKKTDGPLLIAGPHEIVGGAGFQDGEVKKVPDRPDNGRTATTEPAALAEKRGEAGIRIQVGSYTMRENAEYMVRDLGKLGFQAETVRMDIKGKTYFRVYVGDGLTADEAQTILARLNDSGIGGYLHTAE